MNCHSTSHLHCHSRSSGSDLSPSYSNARIQMYSFVVLLRSRFFQRRSISIRFFKKIAISIGLDFHTRLVARSVVLNTSGGPGAMLDRRVMQLSAQLCRPPLLTSKPTKIKKKCCNVYLVRSCSCQFISTLHFKFNSNHTLLCNRWLTSMTSTQRYCKCIGLINCGDK